MQHVAHIPDIPPIAKVLIYLARLGFSWAIFINW
jgi:hypothetical protein